MKKIIIALLIMFSVYLRFVNLQYTSRFTRDESSVIVSIKNIYQNKKITLIGPTDEKGIEVFSSLPFYVLLPFCIIFGFDPMVPAYATAFYGILTIICLGFILKKTHWSYLIFILSIMFTPLLESSRWAWSPHFIPFLQILSLLLLLSKLPYKYILMGLLMGLTIHLHWYAVFTAISILPIIFILDNKFKNLWHYSLGLLLSIMPFILFDISHPPGLFITRMLYFGHQYTTQSSFFSNLWQYTINTFKYFSGNQVYFAYITLIITSISLVFYRTKNHVWLLPFIFQISGLSLISGRYSGHYILPIAIFYIFWLYKNQNIFLIKILTLLLIIFNLTNLHHIITYSDSNSNIKAQKEIINYISQNQLNNPSFNLIVLQSPDKTTKGLRFKDQLKVKNILLKDDSEYQKIDTLYTISYQDKWSDLSQDPAYELNNFRNITPQEIKKIDNSDWIIYKISRTNE